MTLLNSAEFNRNWLFRLSDAPGYAQPDYQDADWRTVSLPHDWSIEDRGEQQSPFFANAPDSYNSGYTRGGTGWYRKTLGALEPGSVYLLVFDGVYMNSEVFVNGHKAAAHYYGYTAFQVDISEFVSAEHNNVIAVRVNNNEKNSRWYSGSGIYRPVQLYQAAPAHIPLWGTQIQTRALNGAKAELQLSTTLSAAARQAGLVLENEIRLNGQQQFQSQQTLAKLPDDGILHQRFSLSGVQPWSPESPVQYQLVQRLREGDTIVDEKVTRFGIRTTEYSPQKGFLLNGQPRLLKGMNLHHDNYLLGAAAHPVAERRKVQTILQAGYNAVRTSHNPASSAFMDAADELGLLVIEEAFDAWNKQKWDNVNDYSSVFARDWQQDLHSFIARDINRPSIILWSVGNEIPEQESPLGSETAQQLIAAVHQLDPSRPVTIGANTSGASAASFLSQFDVVGYNYQRHNYAQDHEAGTAKVMYGSETYSREAFDYWQDVEHYPFVIGDFVWTGWDYLGEASIGWTGYGPQWSGLADYPWTLAYCGEIDALGHWRPAAYYRQVLWQTGSAGVSAFVRSPEYSLSPVPDKDWYDYWTYPDIHPNWTWPGHEGQPLDVTVYSVYPEVELMLNGKVVGKQRISAKDKLTAHFTVPYQPGELVVRGISSQGEVMDTWTLKTSGEPASMQLVREQPNLNSDGLDINYFSVQLLDAQGQEVYYWDYDKSLTVTVKGAADLLALGNAHPHSVESFQRTQRASFRGKLLGVVQSNQRKGKVEITVEGPGMTPASLQFTVE